MSYDEALDYARTSMEQTQYWQHRARKAEALLNEKMIDAWYSPPRPERDIVLGWCEYEDGRGYWVLAQYVKDGVGEFYRVNGRINNNIKKYIHLPQQDWQKKDIKTEENER